MAYVATPEDIQKIRYELADNIPGLYMLSSDEISYFLEKNAPSLERAAIDCCRVLCFKLSARSDSTTVDVLSISGNAKSAAQWLASLKLWLSSPYLRSTSASAWAGGISKSDIAANIANPDNNAVLTPPCTSTHDNTCSYQTSSNPFLI